jgi:hypothetical protein
MKTGIFEVGKTYYSMTRSGTVRLFKVTNVLKRKSTGERVYVVGSYDDKPERRYEIKKPGQDEFIYVDDRFATVIDTHLYKSRREA